jgi:hypothetical protein
MWVIHHLGYFFYLLTQDMGYEDGSLLVPFLIMGMFLSLPIVIVYYLICLKWTKNIKMKKHDDIEIDS